MDNLNSQEYFCLFRTIGYTLYGTYLDREQRIMSLKSPSKTLLGENYITFIRMGIGDHNKTSRKPTANAGATDI